MACLQVPQYDILQVIRGKPSPGIPVLDWEKAFWAIQKAGSTLPVLLGQGDVVRGESFLGKADCGDEGILTADQFSPAVVKAANTLS
jgi:hypothetical protein